MSPGSRAASISRRAWLVWVVAVATYLVAVLQRTSLGVAGLQAAERLEVSAAVLSTLAVVQLAVYAGMQIPVGLLVDRVGPRVLMATGAFLMAAGQTLLALSDTLAPAVIARMMVGAGDAMTWLCAIRLVAAWFPARRIPIMTQVTALTGQLGQVLSAIPLLALLAGPGWAPAFLSAAALGALCGALALMVLRDGPGGRVRPTTALSWPALREQLGQTWRNPGTRLAFWTHVITPFSSTMFLLLWGFPFLVSAQGRPPEVASSLFTYMVVVGMVASPVLGLLVARYPLRRSLLVLGVTMPLMAVWAAVLALPGPSPLWLLVALTTLLAIAGPASVIAFDFARTFNPPERFGTASGMANVGGFSAALITVLAVGVLLNLTGAGRTYDLEGFRVALSFQFVVWAVGLTGFVRARRRARARLAEQGVVVRPMREVIRRARRM